MKKLVFGLVFLLVVTSLVSAALTSPLNESAVPGETWDVLSKETIFAVVVLGIALILFLIYWLLQSGLGGS